MSTAHARRLRRVVIRDGFRCKKCHVIPIYPTTDHILPKIFGGTSKDHNLQMLCLMCHREKDELGGRYRVTEESMVCGMSVFEKKVLKRFRIAVGVYSTGSLWLIMKSAVKCYRLNQIECRISFKSLNMVLLFLQTFQKLLPIRVDTCTNANL